MDGAHHRTHGINTTLVTTSFEIEEFQNKHRHLCIVLGGWQMKKAIISSLVVALFFLFVVYEIGTKPVLAESTELTAYGIDEDDGFAEDEIDILTNQYGLYGSLTTTEDEGTYAVFSDPSSGEGRLLIYDHDIKQLRFLSEEEEKGRIDSVVGGAFPLCYNNFIYVVKYGYAHMSNIPTVIYQYEKDGAFLSAYTFPTDSIICAGSRIAGYRGNLIILSEVYDEKTRQRTAVNIISIDVDDGESVVLFQLSNNGNYQIVGSCDDCLLLEHVEVEDVVSKHTIVRCSLNDGTLSEPVLSWNHGDLSYCCFEEKIYYSKNESTILEAVDIYDFNQEIVFDFGTEVEDVSIVGTVDGRILFRQYPSGNYGKYFNCKDGKSGEIRISAGLLGDTNDFYFISLGEKSVSYLQEINGNMVESTMGIVEYALIDKEDFWSNRNNFIRFEDAVYNSQLIFRESKIQ